MQYQNMSSEFRFKFESKNFLSILGLYFFSLGATLSGYSFYLLLEAIGIIDRKIITWNGQGLFWFLILFFTGLFILFIPVEFFNVFKTYNTSFKDLIMNIIYSILISLFFLVVFQYSFKVENSILNDISSIGKAVSFAGFISVPLVLFLQHTLRSALVIIDKISYGFTLFVWIISAQIFL